MLGVGEELLKERRRRRRAGDPRLSAEDREILRRVTRGDLAGEFQAALDADPLLGVSLPDASTEPWRFWSVIAIGEYLAVDVVRDNWPDGLPDDDLALPATRHYRLLQRIHDPSSGQLSAILARSATPVVRGSVTPTPKCSRCSTPARSSTRSRRSGRGTAPVACWSPKPSPPG